MTNFILIGCGQVATLAHLPALDLLSKEGVLKISGVCDVDAQRARQLAGKHGISEFHSEWKLLAKKCSADAVTICLPPGPNAQVAAEAAAMGLHVICEKPPGRTLEDSRRMAEAAAANPGVRTMIAFNRRFAPLFEKARALSRAIGEPNLFYGRFSRPSLGGVPSNTVKGWVTSDGSHVLDLAVAVMGCPEKITVAKQKIGSDIDNVWAIQMQSPQGSSLIYFHFGAGQRLERFEWSGPGYDAILELPNKAWWTVQRSPTEEWAANKITGRTDELLNYGFVEEYRAFVEAIKDPSLPITNDFKYGHRFMELVSGILSAPPGETVQVQRGAEIAAQPPPKTAALQSGMTQTSAKPVVHILQGPKARETYFEMEDLHHLACRTDLRFQNGDEMALEDLQAADVLVAGWGGAALTAKALEQAGKLKLVVVLGASVKQVFPEALLNREITLCNTADAIAQSVAEHCLMVALAGLRQLVPATQRLRNGGWQRDASRASLILGVSKFLPGALKQALRGPAKPMLSKLQSSRGGSKISPGDLRGQMVGLVGWGQIARRFAELLRPFSCEILVFSKHALSEELKSYNARKAALGEIFGSCKIVSLHRGLSKMTRGMIGAQELSLMRPGSILINTARGPLVNEEALIKRLSKGDLIAALDVFDIEPPPKNHPLRKLPNVILTPHNAGATNDCNRRVGKEALALVQAWLDNRETPGLSPSQLQMMT